MSGYRFVLSSDDVCMSDVCRRRQSGDQLEPPIHDREFLDMLATDVDVLDTTPAEAVMGEIARMPELATVVVETGPTNMRFWDSLPESLPPNTVIICR